jgi:hypothetical protein
MQSHSQILSQGTPWLARAQIPFNTCRVLCPRPVGHTFAVYRRMPIIYSLVSTYLRVSERRICTSYFFGVAVLCRETIRLWRAQSKKWHSLCQKSTESLSPKAHPPPPPLTITMSVCQLITRSPILIILVKVA